MPVKIDRLDVDQMQRIRESEVWKDFERRIVEKRNSLMRSCTNGELDEKQIRLAQGGVGALNFVLQIPDQIQNDVVRKNKDAA